MTLRVLSYNIRYGGSGRERPIAQVIKACQPDLVILQEAVRPDVVDRLCSDCGMARCGAIGGNSLAFLTRVELSHHAWHRVPFAKRRYLEVVLAQSKVRLFGVHLSAIHSNPTERRRAYELRALLNGIKDRQDGLHVIAGDFNTVSPGDEFNLRKLPPRLRAIVWLTGRSIRWTTIQLMLGSGYLDAYRIHHQHDLGYTFPTWDPHVRLDYAFVPSAFASRVTRCDVIRDIPHLREASDHFPLLFELEIPEPA